MFHLSDKRKAFVQIAKVSCLNELELTDFIGQWGVWTLPFVAKENKAKQMQSAEGYVKPEEFSQARVHSTVPVVL